MQIQYFIEGNTSCILPKQFFATQNAIHGVQENCLVRSFRIRHGWIVHRLPPHFQATDSDPVFHQLLYQDLFPYDAVAVAIVVLPSGVDWGVEVATGGASCIWYREIYGIKLRPIFPASWSDVLRKNWNLCDFENARELRRKPIVLPQVSDGASAILPLRYRAPRQLNFHILRVINYVWCLVWAKSVFFVSARLLGIL